MTKAAIVCVDRDPTSLRARSHALERAFGEYHVVVGLETANEAIQEIESRSADGRPIAVLLCDEAIPAAERQLLFERIADRFPSATKALLASPKARPSPLDRSAIDGLDACISNSCRNEVFLLDIRNLLARFELMRRLNEQQRALERKAKRLEALHEVGVGLAGSFDIDAILRQIMDATTAIVGEGVIDLYYAGSSAINARPRWLPAAPSRAHLSTESRSDLVEVVASVLHPGTSPEADTTVRLRSYVHRLPGGEGREIFPIAQNLDLLGLVVVKPQTPPDDEVRGLLSILTLQASTALYNIHLTQERIQFERLAAFGQMIGSLVHDFRSPLTAVRGYVGMLAGLDLMAEERRDYAQLAVEECDRLGSMIDELLEFTRGGRSHLKIQRISLRDFLEELKPAIETHFPSEAVRFEMELEYDGELHVDPHRLCRAVLNVVSNASQAMNGSGAFLIRTERQGNDVILEFIDTGSGIPEEIRHRIFDPFFSYGKPQGIGLGMSITRKIVEEHGGRISLMSEVGHGTRVRFILPLEPATHELAPADGTRCRVTHP